MTDKQIGIKLDVRQTGLQQVDDALDTISKNLSGMNESVIKQQQKGWGSESQTKELREQLRYMQQMTNLYERIARTQGRDSSSFGNFRHEMSKMERDMNSLPSYRTGALGGYVHQRFGENAATGLDKVVSAIGKLGTLYAGFSIASTVHSGFSRGDQLAFGYGDISKRMGNRGSALTYAKGMTRELDGYGYDDMSVMQATSNYSTTTGRMNPNDLKSQMQTILSTGRRFGMSDPSQVVQGFSDAFTSGITGGSAQQMKPKEFADLLANAVATGRMQGKEGKLLEQLTQVTQMSMSSMGNAGNEKTIAALLSMGNRTGNQALIGNLPNMISSIDRGISNPSGGYGAQALMMRAIGGGKMNFWDEQYLQSKGALGREEDENGNEFGQTNIEKATNYLMNAFKGNKSRQYAMLGQMFNLKPSQAKKYIDVYTKNGQFDSETLKNIQSDLGQTPTAIPQTDTDRYRADQQSQQTGADVGIGESTTNFRTGVSGIIGDILKSPVGVGVGAGVIGGSTGLLIGKGMTIFKGARKLLEGFKSVGSGAAGGSASIAAQQVAAALVADPPILGPNGQPLASSGSATKAASGAMKSFSSKIVGPAAAIAEGFQGYDWGGDLGDWLFGHKKGDVKVGGDFLGDFSMKKWEESRDPIWKRLFSPSSSTSTDQFHTPQGPPDPANMSSSASGQELAPIVISTILALQPYMEQIKGALGVDSASVKTSSLSTEALKNPFVQNTPLTPNNNAGIQLASFNPNIKRVDRGSNRTNNSRSSDTGYSIVGGGNVSVDGINKMLKGTSLDGHGQDFIDAASEYGINPSALVGIVRAEQSFNNPYGSNNLTGITNDVGLGDGRMFGANDGQKLPGFSSIKDGLRAASKNLSSYAKNGTINIDDVAKKWVGNSNWSNEADTIKKTMDQLGVRPEIDASKLSTASLGASGNVKVSGGSITVHVKTDKETQTFKAPISAEFTGLREA